jgi:hypothetical protein
MRRHRVYTQTARCPPVIFSLLAFASIGAGWTWDFSAVFF